MIFDRTQEDVDNAIRLIEEKVKAFEKLTSSEIATLERGTITANTLNRIESKQKELAQRFNSYGFSISIQNKTNWSDGSILQYSDYARILTNLSALKNAFYILNTTPDTPTYLYGFNELNAVEKILADLEFLINGMIGIWVYIGSDCYMGGVV